MATNPTIVPIANKVNKTQLQTLASGGSVTQGGNTYTADERALYLTEETIDTTPTASSDNLVTSGGVYSALQNKADTSDIPTVNNPTITVTQGGVTKGTFTLNQSSAQTIALDAGGGGSSTDVQINSTSITSGGVANIQTKGTYNASTNKIATESDLPPAITITTTSGSESVSDGTNMLNFGANAFNSTTIPTSYVSSLNGNTGAITKVPIQSSTTTTADKVLLSTSTANSVSWSSSAKGSTTKPVYLNSSGVLSEGSTYAGGTAVTLNGTSKSGAIASFYAPTGVGISGQILQSYGSGSPIWTDLYPVGAVYFSTVNTSPASVFGGTWTQILSNATIPLGSSFAVAGNGKTIMLTNGNTDYGLFKSYAGNRDGLALGVGGAGTNAGSSPGASVGNPPETVGLTTTAANSGMVASASSSLSGIYAWKRTA